MSKGVLVLEDMTTTYRGWIEDLGYGIDDYFHKDLAFVVFTGGSDINPKLYGEKRHHSVIVIDKHRDLAEIEIFKLARKNKIPMVGICRGAQMLCALNGDKLIQDVKGHKDGVHNVVLTGKSKKSFFVTSTHHQMMSPETSGTLLAYSDPISSVYTLNKGNSVYSIGEREPEAIRWDNTRSLAVQWHPERMSSVSEGRIVVGEWIKELIS